MPGGGDPRRAMDHVAYICAGSNIGDRRAHIQKGFDALLAAGHSRRRDQSPFYMTEPVDFTDQAWFLNAVLSVDTALAPLELLRELKSIEKASGRDYDTVRFGPRTLDLDILFYDDLATTSPELTIPHPRMHERRFVLTPLCDIDAGLVHPIRNRRVDALLADLAEDGQRIVPI